MAFDPIGRPAAETPDKDPIIRPFRDFGKLGSLYATTTIQKAIDWTSSANDTDGEGNVAVGQGGIFDVEGVVIRHGARLILPGRTAALIRAVGGASPDELFALDEGPVQKVELSGFTIDMSAMPTQHALYFKAVPILIDGVLQGGLWDMRFRDLWIRGCTKESFWLRGGGDALNAPNQFIKLESVVVESAGTDATGHALRLTGQVGQVQADAACRFDGISKATAGTNILIERTVDDAGANNGDAMPYTIILPVTCQSRRRLVTVERGLAISFEQAHFEEAEEGVNVDVSSGLTSVVGAYFGNVGHNGGGTGFLARVDSGRLVVGKNFVGGTVDTHFVRRFGGQLTLLGADADDNGITTDGATLQVACTASIDTGVFKTVFVDGGSATNVDTIDSSLQPGEYLSLRANGGRVRFASGGNIDLGGAFDPFILPSGATLTLVRNDLSGVWQVVGVSGPRGAYYGLPVFVNAAASPYQVPPDVDTVRVDASGGVVTIKLPSRDDTPPGKEVTVKKIDSSSNQVRVNGFATAQNPDGQADNVSRLVDQTQALTYRRNGTVGSGGWDTVSSVSARSGAPGVGALLTFGTHLTGTSYDGSAPITLATDATPNNVGSTIMSRDTNGDFGARVAVLGSSDSAALFVVNAAGHNAPFIGNVLGRTGSGSADDAIIGAFGRIVFATNNTTAQRFVMNTDGTLEVEGNGGGFCIGARASTYRLSVGGDIAGAFSFFNTGNNNAPLTVSSITYRSTGVGPTVAGTTYYDASLGGVTTIAKAGASYDWSVWNPAASTAVISIPTGTNNVQVQNDILLNTNTRGFVISGTRRLSVSTAGVDVTGTFTVSGTSNFISGVLVVSSSGFSTTKPVAVNTATSTSGLDIADSAGNTGMSFTPATSGDSVFIDNRRVGSATQFRCSNASASDRTWLSVSAAAVATFGFGVVFSSTINVSGTASMAGATFSSGVTFNSTALFNGAASFSTIGTDLVPASSGSRDLGGGVNRWRDVYTSGNYDSSGGSLRTGSPTGGTRNTWKLGDYIAGTFSVDFAHAVEVEIGGALRKFAVLT